MATVIVKKGSYEKPKEDTWRYVKAKFETDILFCHYNKQMDEWHDADLTIHTDNISFWLEEVELPTDKEIDSTFPLQYGMEILNFNSDCRKGAKWMRDCIGK